MFTTARACSKPVVIRYPSGRKYGTEPSDNTIAEVLDAIFSKSPSVARRGFDPGTRSIYAAKRSAAIWVNGSLSRETAMTVGRFDEITKRPSGDCATESRGAPSLPAPAFAVPATKATLDTPIPLKSVRRVNSLGSHNDMAGSPRKIRNDSQEPRRSRRLARGPSRSVKL